MSCPLCVTDRGYFNSLEILACHEAGITVTLPKRMTSNAKAEGRFGKQDFVYVETQDVYTCPAGRALTYRMTTQEGDKAMRRYWTTECGSCLLKKKCTTAPERRIPRWEHEHVLEAAQARLDADPQAMRRRRENRRASVRNAQAPHGRHALPDDDAVTAEMALHVLAYNLTLVMNIMGVKPRWPRSECELPRRCSHGIRTNLGFTRAFLHDQDPNQTKPLKLS